MDLCQVKFKLTSASPVLFCSMHNTEQMQGETPDAYERRTWKDRCHTKDNGEIIIPGYMFQKTLEPAGKLTGERIGGRKQGKGLSNYLATVRVLRDISTGVKKDDVHGVTAFVSSTGKPDGGRVPRTYPKIESWEGVLVFTYPDLGILNDVILEKYLQIAGQCIGIGHWRPSSPSRGSYGLFTVKKLVKKDAK